jgi:hypothetical protein
MGELENELKNAKTHKNKTEPKQARMISLGKTLLHVGYQ